MWERGLKLHGHDVLGTAPQSLPMWERGLKHRLDVQERLTHPCRSLCGSVD